MGGLWGGGLGGITGVTHPKKKNFRWILCRKIKRELNGTNKEKTVQRPVSGEEEKDTKEISRIIFPLNF